MQITKSYLVTIRYADGRRRSMYSENRILASMLIGYVSQAHLTEIQGFTFDEIDHSARVSIGQVLPPAIEITNESILDVINEDWIIRMRPLGT